MRLEKQPRDTASATAGAGAKQGARSVRALEVLGGDDIDSDGDEAPLAEEEVLRAEGVVGEVVEEVKVEPTPDLGPTIKWEPSYNRRQRQQKQRPTCVRSAKWSGVSGVDARSVA